MQISSNRIRHPREQLQNRAQHLDHLELRLRSAGHQHIRLRRQQLDAALRAFSHSHPEQDLKVKKEDLLQAGRKLERAMRTLLRQREGQLIHAGQLLHNVSPLAVLERGYAIVKDDRGNILKRADSALLGQRLHTRLASGEFTAVVDKILE